MRGSNEKASGNLAYVRNWFADVWNHRREKAIYDVMTSESICTMDGRILTGPDEFRDQQYLPILAAFPDLHVEVDNAIQQDEQIVLHWRATGTHSGDETGAPPTERAALFQGVTWLFTRDGKITEAKQYSNIQEVLRRCAAPPAEI